ncbi:hypothetical protein B0H13DRAFT_2417201 [Mycena leptocephala]|nr:hypothetical protein B0H13DRAFT_2417201 [Mycena leptocephala]
MWQPNGMGDLQLGERYCIWISSSFRSSGTTYPLQLFYLTTSPAGGQSIFFITGEGKHSFKEVELRLADKDKIFTVDGKVEINRKNTPSSFISIGITLEEALYISMLVYTSRHLAIDFWKLQATYMPGLRQALTQQQRKGFDGVSLPDETWLFLPSDLLDAAAWHRACFPGLRDVEGEYWEAEARDALEEVRQANALLRLRGHGPWERTLRVLHDDDLRALNEGSLTTEERANADRLEALGEAAVHGIAAAGAVAAGEGSRTLSWIWYSSAEAVESEHGLQVQEALCVEWCKALARSRRNNEELRILEELC